MTAFKTTLAQTVMAYFVGKHCGVVSEEMVIWDPVFRCYANLCLRLILNLSLARRYPSASPCSVLH